MAPSRTEKIPTQTQDSELLRLTDEEVYWLDQMSAKHERETGVGLYSS